MGVWRSFDKQSSACDFLLALGVSASPTFAEIHLTTADAGYASVSCTAVGDEAQDGEEEEDDHDHDDDDVDSDDPGDISGSSLRAVLLPGGEPLYGCRNGDQGRCCCHSLLVNGYISTRMQSTLHQSRMATKQESIS